jgi:hypothetical protein
MNSNPVSADVHLFASAAISDSLRKGMLRIVDKRFESQMSDML